MEFSFSVIAVSETWTPKRKIEVKPSKTQGYKNYYVKEGIKFKLRKDLDIACHDTDNEFKFTWIEILNSNKPNIIIGVYYRHPLKFHKIP